MAEKPIQTHTKVKTAVVVTIGVIAFLVIALLIVIFRNVIAEGLFSRVKVTYEGMYNPFVISGNALVTAAEKEISGQPELRPTDPTQGSSSPKIKIFEFGSFNSGYSAAAQSVVEQIVTDYGGEVQIIWKDYFDQTDSIARLGAEAARCGQQQNKFWEMQKVIYQTQGGFTRDKLIELAKGLNLNLDNFNSCLDKKEVDGVIDQNISEAIQLHLPGAPIFFVDDKVLKGVVTYREFEALVKQELKGK
ncbi:MAG: thioredoxin domain-containing protein [Patescibacteria group bacterium]|nr:thioredoxin domain-containing protein [Patescibacteria group bacterium]